MSRRPVDTLPALPGQLMPNRMHRRGSGNRTGAWNKRPFPPPALSYIGQAPDGATRALGNELVRGYSGSELSLTWVLSITVAPGSGSMFALHFESRFPDGQPYELAAYDFAWRELLGEAVPAKGLSAYARVIYEQAAAGILVATHHTYDAWSEARCCAKNSSVVPRGI
jgi:hypothetical protein